VFVLSVFVLYLFAMLVIPRTILPSGGLILIRVDEYDEKAASFLISK
jgi:hypothetical protein